MIEIFIYFLKLGTTGFGGPIALIGMMEQHWVRDQKTISENDFHQFVAAAKLFPGPIAPLVAIRIGYHFSGIKGGAIAGLCLILPAFFMILMISYFMRDLNNYPHPTLSQMVLGLNFGGLALSVVAAMRFAKPLISKDTLFYLVFSGILTYLYPKQEVIFLISCGILSLIHQHYKNKILEASSVFLSLIFFESLKASLCTFGSGIAIIPALKSIYIDHYHWVTHSEFLTALSFGQMTPGPMVILNTYLGNQIAQLPGAVAATVGTFLPTFTFGLIIMPYFEKRLLNAPKLKIFFAGMLPAVGGAILGSVFRLCLFAIQDNSRKNILTHSLLLIGLVLISIKSKLHPIIILIYGAMLAVLGFRSGIIR